MRTQPSLKNLEAFLAQVPEERHDALRQLHDQITRHLPPGFQEVLQGGMLCHVVPHTVYPNGYHCNPSEPLPFLSLASQKNFIALYHMGLYANQSLNDWFVAEYPKHARLKLDMGKSCIRFKKLSDIPFDLIGELCSKMSPNQWINLYESYLKQ